MNYLLMILAVSVMATLLILALLRGNSLKNEFQVWRRKPFKKALCRAYSDGLINSYQMHELAARMDAPRKERIKPKGGYQWAMGHATLFALSLSIAFGASLAQAQTNQPVAPPLQIPGISWDWLTNIPSAKGLDSAKFGLSLGVVVNGAIENEVKLDAYVKTNWMVSAAIQNSPSSSVIDKMSIHAGYRAAAPNYELYAQFMGRRNWTTDAANIKPSYQIGADFGGSWVPVTGGTWLLGAEFRVLTSDTGKVFDTRPQAEALAFLKKAF